MTNHPAPCPGRQYYTTHAAPWVEPQPDDPPCPVCVYSLLTSEIYLELNSSLPGSLSDPVVHFVDVNGDSHSIALPVHSDELVPGAVVLVTEVSFPQDIKSATVEFVVDGHMSTVDPLLPL